MNYQLRYTFSNIFDTVLISYVVAKVEKLSAKSW